MAGREVVGGENNKVGESGSRGGHKVGGRKGWEGLVESVLPDAGSRPFDLETHE